MSNAESTRKASLFLPVLTPFHDEDQHPPISRFAPSTTPSEEIDRLSQTQTVPTTCHGSPMSLVRGSFSQSSSSSPWAAGSSNDAQRRGTTMSLQRAADRGTRNNLAAVPRSPRLVVHGSSSSKSVRGKKPAVDRPPRRRDESGSPKSRSSLTFLDGDSEVLLVNGSTATRTSGGGGPRGPPARRKSKRFCKASRDCEENDRRSFSVGNLCVFVRRGWLE